MTSYVLLFYLADVEQKAVRCGVGAECSVKDGIRGCHCLVNWHGNPDPYTACESESILQINIS